MKMSTCSILMLVLLMSLGLFAQDLSKLTFEKFTSVAGKYSVMFPGKPTTQKQNAKIESANVEVTIDVVSIGQNLAFMVSYYDFPDAMKNVDPETLIMGVRNGNKGKDGEILSDEAIQYGADKLPGHKVLIKKPGGINIKTMIILKRTSLYQVFVVGKEELINSKELDPFQKSFQLTK